MTPGDYEVPFHKGLNRITAKRVADYPSLWINRAGLTVPELGRVIPVGISSHRGRSPLLEVAINLGMFTTVSLSVIPHSRLLPDTATGSPEGQILAIHHRKGNKSSREDKLRLLRITDVGDPQGFPQTDFYIGEHDDHPDQWGVYMWAQHVGEIGLRFLADGEIENLKLLDASDVWQKFFPIGPAADVGL